ncbi:hypothetical protein [Bacteroides sp. An269]|uniref:hypothetical protein n=1 Tax=Bacteroides sp. An269 TaxID=1965613 RepID=UPI000B36B252|nr:hypothetical protein [Bacteroides sp. An269]OUO74908.1 hypothetical protein B5F71_11295 [Bacteroides sp. An269]
MDVHDIEAWRKLLKERGAALEKLRQIQETIGLSKEDRMKYEASLKVYRDQLVTIEYARQQGFAEGEAEERLKNARDMKAAGIAPDLIAQITGLPLETVEGL